MKVPGLPAHVYFGSVDAPVPDWRAHPEPRDPDLPLTEEERKTLIARLGFDHRNPSDVNEEYSDDPEDSDE